MQSASIHIQKPINATATHSMGSMITNSGHPMGPMPASMDIGGFMLPRRLNLQETRQVNRRLHLQGTRQVNHRLRQVHLRH